VTISLNNNFFQLFIAFDNSTNINTNIMKRIVLNFVVFLCCHLIINAQENLTYQKPSSEILALADYERAPGVTMDSKKEFILFTYRDTYKSLNDLYQEEMRLGGLRINPVTNISSTVSYINNLKIRKIASKDEVQVSGLAQNVRISYVSMSPNEKKIAFTNTTNSGVELWVLDVETAQARRLTDAILNANLGNPVSWLSDNENMLVKLLPKNRAALIDTKKDLAKGPTVSVSDGSISQNPTFQDLLKNQSDEQNFETLVTSDLYKISISGNADLFKPSAMYSDVRVSPDGNYVFITSIQKPFSYVVPFYRFPQKSVVYDIKGNEIKVVNEVPLIENIPKGFDSAPTGKREMRWRDDKPSTLYYVVALDEGDKAKKAEFRDEVFLWNAPFGSEPASLFKTRQRFAGIIWGNDRFAIGYDQWYDTRNMKTYLINPSSGELPRVIYDRNIQDIYSDPGNFETKKDQNGRYRLLIEKDYAFLIGDGYSKDGQFPFIDELNLTSLKTKRLYQSEYKDKKEDLLSIEDAEKGDVLVMLQSKNEFPNYYFRDIKNKGKLEQITYFKNPFESIKNVYKEVIRYKRKDGVELSGTLYLPVGYDTVKKEKLPLLMWAYPVEYKDKNSAGQNDQNPNQFTYPNYGSFVYWVTKGYVVLDNASFPIVGEGTTEPNDNFIDQLVSSAEAAIDAVNKRGFINPKKVAVGGHSYGAFMTANLLTHSDLFACGIARSGAYNRTLTPFGFQNEQRNYWDAPEIYNTMSPFMHADKMKTPLLLVHGDADNNPGTFTLQSERYFQALKGLGAPVRLVLLPKESHGYAARENILHLLWEQDQFFEKYLK
jgi:dipeptidyl aminopeptidase/acylaminoacyl peptidase